MARVKIGEMLVQQGHLDGAQLESALAHQRKWGGRIGRAIVHLGFMRENTLLEAVGRQLGVPVVEIGSRFVPQHVVQLVPEKLVRTRRVLPIARLSEHRRGPLVVALADPHNLEALDEVAFATGMQVRPVLASEADLDQAIARLVDGHAEQAAPSHFSKRTDAIELPEDTSPLTLIRRDEIGKHTLH